MPRTPPHCPALVPDTDFVPFLPACARWGAGRLWLSQRRGTQMPDLWGTFSLAHPLHPLFLPTSQNIKPTNKSPLSTCSSWESSVAEELCAQGQRSRSKLVTEEGLKPLACSSMVSSHNLLYIFFFNVLKEVQLLQNHK